MLLLVSSKNSAVASVYDPLDASSLRKHVYAKCSIIADKTSKILKSLYFREKNEILESFS